MFSALSPCQKAFWGGWHSLVADLRLCASTAAFSALGRGGALLIQPWEVRAYHTPRGWVLCGRRLYAGGLGLRGERSGTGRAGLWWRLVWGVQQRFRTEVSAAIFSGVFTILNGTAGLYLQMVWFTIWRQMHVHSILFGKTPSHHKHALNL